MNRFGPVQSSPVDAVIMLRSSPADWLQYVKERHGVNDTYPLQGGQCMGA